MKRVLITGANGFIGRPVCAALAKGKVEVRAAVRDETGLGRLPVGIKGVATGGLDFIPDWKPFLEGVDAV
ncbi:MAG: NAD-dependent epimerase/dehydratase family protein, partial [Nitrospiria bacterium]